MCRLRGDEFTELTELFPASPAMAFRDIMQTSLGKATDTTAAPIRAYHTCFSFKSPEALIWLMNNM